MKKHIKKDNGFTLIELMVTIAIIAILAATVLVSMQNYAAKGRTSRAMAQASSAIPAMVSCWGNGGKVTPSGTNICDIGPGYGTWPDMSSINYSFKNVPIDKSASWSFTVESTKGDPVICCNSGMNSCGLPTDGSTCGPGSIW